jgi:hypothetical protein
VPAALAAELAAGVSCGVALRLSASTMCEKDGKQYRDQCSHLFFGRSPRNKFKLEPAICVHSSKATYYCLSGLCFDGGMRPHYRHTYRQARPSICAELFELGANSRRRHLTARAPGVPWMAVQGHMDTDRIMEEWSTRSAIQLQQGHYKITCWRL